MQAPYTAVPSVADAYDVVCVFFHQAQRVPLDALLVEAWRVLKPGGLVLAVVPATMRLMNWPRSAAASPTYRKDELRTSLARFTDLELYRRHIRRAELAAWYRWLPRPLLERWLGRFLIAKAIKPLQLQHPLRVVA
jgi:SAM-dependent methyltransferase